MNSELTQRGMSLALEAQAEGEQECIFLPARKSQFLMSVAQQRLSRASLNL